MPGAHLLAFSRDRLGFLCRLKHEYGDVVAFRLGPERTVLLSHPEHMHEVLVRQHRAFLKGRRGDVSKQFLGQGLLNSEGAQRPIGVVLVTRGVQPVQACVATRRDQGGIPVLGIALSRLKTDHGIVAPIDRRHDGAGGAVIDAEQHSILLSTDEENTGCTPATVARGGKVRARALG